MYADLGPGLEAELTVQPDAGRNILYSHLYVANRMQRIRGSLYEYASSNPITLVDPTGEDAKNAGETCFNVERYCDCGNSTRDRDSLTPGTGVEIFCHCVCKVAPPPPAAPLSPCNAGSIGAKATTISRGDCQGAFFCVGDCNCSQDWICTPAGWSAVGAQTGDCTP
jgi:hypothetical protein